MSDCVLCFSTILKNNDKNLVKSRGEFKVQEEILSLQFIVHETSPYICRSCVGKLRKRRGLYANVRKIEDELFSDYSSKAFKVGLTVKKKIETLGRDSIGTSASPEKRILLEESVDRSSNDLSSLVTSTPVKAVHNASVRKIQIPPLSPVRPVIMERSEGNDSGTENKTVVQVKVQWPSKTKVNTLTEGLESLGKMLCRGTYGQIATAAWKNPMLRKHLQQHFLKEVDKECSDLCSVKNPSCLRSTKAQDLEKFSFNKLEKELQSRAPLLSAVLWTASLRKSKRAGEDPFWKPSVCMAAATLLKNRSPCMTLLQLMNTIIIYHSGIMVSLFKIFIFTSIRFVPSFLKFLNT